VDTVTMMVSEGVPWSSRALEASLPALQAGGVDVVVQAAWIERGVEDPRGMALGKLRRIRAMVEQSHGAAAIVTGPEQLERVVAEGRIAVVLALEGGTALTGGEETLRELHALGLRMIGLTWSESSPFADSSAEPRAGDAGGLTEAGREMVRLCNDLGILLDVSHMSDRATADVLELSRAPVLASHSNAKAVRDVPRNLSDELLAGISARGGLVGAMFHGPFLADDQPATRADAVTMIRALTARVGAAHVGIGTDFDGIIQPPTGLTSARDLPALRDDLLASGLTPEEVSLILGGSFLRFWRAADSARTRR
jgi:membrane dipeptidase